MNLRVPLSLSFFCVYRREEQEAGKCIILLREREREECDTHFDKEYCITYIYVSGRYVICIWERRCWEWKDVSKRGNKWQEFYSLFLLPFRRSDTNQRGEKEPFYANGRMEENPNPFDGSYIEFFVSSVSCWQPNWWLRMMVTMEWRWRKKQRGKISSGCKAGYECKKCLKVMNKEVLDTEIDRIIAKNVCGERSEK